MSEYARQIHALLAEAEQLPVCQAKLALLQDAVRLADFHHDVPLGVQARYALTYVARNLLRGDVLAVAFTWLLAQYDRNPELFAGQNLFWQYGETIGLLANLDTIPRAKIEELLADFRQRLLSAGLSPAADLRKRRAVAPDLGDRVMAAEADRELCLRYPSERGEVLHVFEHLLFVDDEEAAVAFVEPHLRDPRRGPHWAADTIHQRMLLPLLRRGRVKELLRELARCLAAARPEVCYYWAFGEILKALALTGRTTAAVGFYERCQRAMGPYTDPLTRLHFALDAVVLFDRLGALGCESLALRLTDAVPVPAPDGRYRVAELGGWLRREALDLAARFDQRNGNAYYDEELGKRAHLQQLALPEVERMPEGSG